jgi:hypothetical protein
MKLWLVKIADGEFEYDCFVDGVVWADTPEEAEQLIRDNRDGMGDGLPHGDATRLIVEPAPTSGVAHVHVEAG